MGRPAIGGSGSPFKRRNELKDQVEGLLVLVERLHDLAEAKVNRFAPTRFATIAANVRGLGHDLLVKVVESVPA